MVRQAHRQTAPETLVGHLAASVAKDRPAIQIGDCATITYAQLLSLAELTAERLVAAGISPGDRILIAVPNSAEHVVAVLAVLSLGGIAVPVDTATGTERLAHVVENSLPRVCLYRDDPPVPLTIPAVRLTIDPATGSFQLSPGDERQQVAEKRYARAGTDDDALIRYSSGSTGRPKGVVLTHGQSLHTARTLADIFGLSEAHRELIIAPMAYSGGWQRVTATLVSGGCVIIGHDPLPSLAGLMEDAETLGASGFFTPPPMVRMMLKAAPDKVGRALASCRSIEIGSAPLTGSELEQFLDLVPTARVFVHYGLTECSRAVILDTRAHPDKLGTVGKPTPGIELVTRDHLGRELGSGQAGELFLRGPQRTDRYWGDPELTRERIVDGWLATGDVGTVDDDGFVSILGRTDDLITSGGHSFFPAEAEMELGDVPGVAYYLIAGVSDPRGVLGQVPWAFVVPAESANWAPGKFLALAKARLPSYMVPRGVASMSALPLTASGKLDRRRAVLLHFRTTRANGWTEQ